MSKRKEDSKPAPFPRDKNLGVDQHPTSKGPRKVTLEDEIRGYLTQVLSVFGRLAASGPAPADEPDIIAAKVFNILTSREFCYMGRTRSDPYQEETVRLIAARVKNKEPLRFYYDIGAGYHATLYPGAKDLSFEVGLSELLILSQAMSFCRRVAPVYPVGVEFRLVIDNVCALMTNDVPLEKTTAYCKLVRTLIEQLDVGDTVKTLVESEQFPLSAYKIDQDELEKQMRAINPTEWDVENVCRFMGRSCGEQEVVERMARYKQTGPMTDGLFAGIIRDVHMTQRATATTLGFRPFPGGDSRTQCGQVGLTRRATGNLRPVLLTSRNVSDFALTRLEFPGLLPSVISHVTYAERK